jgi:hypothetical protein
MTDTLNTEWPAARRMISVDDFAALPHTPQTRAIRTALKEQRVTGAEWDPHANGGRGRWLIPSDAEVLPRTGTTVQRATPAAAPATPAPASLLPADLAALLEQPPLRDIVDRLPAYLSPDLAARLLGIPTARILEDPAAYEAESIGIRHALLVPKRIVMIRLGLVA